jgi:hypothetical protein
MKSLYNHHKQTKMSLKNKGQEGKTSPVLGLVPVGGHKERVKEGKYDGSTMYPCM